MIRIAITGPESTGKSWLAQQLADYYNVDWSPEYARVYLENLNRPYNYDDILTIARGQSEQEDAFASKSRLLFCDTDYCVTSIWCKVKYKKCHPWITKMLKQNTYGLYLLCDIDLPWEFDPMREHPDRRGELFDMYLDLLKKHHFNYKIVQGSGETRLLNAIHIVDEYLFANNLSVKI